MRPTFRHGTLADLRPVYDVFTATSEDLERRMGTSELENIWTDPAFVANHWERRRPLFEHLTRTAEHFWIAELNGEMIGYARTSHHDGVRELIEFFVLPNQQAAGVGRELLARSFPVEGARRRVVIATTDIRALSRYLKAGVYPRFPIYYFSRKPEQTCVTTDLVFEPAADTSETIAAIRAIDEAILEFARDPDHAFLMRDRQLFLFRRRAKIAGYGYLDRGTGPIALLDESHFPAVLARAETEAAELGEEEFGVEVPLINRAAVDYLLGRGCRLQDFTVLFMSDAPFGRFENYIVTSPPFFM